MIDRKIFLFIIVAIIFSISSMIAIYIEGRKKRRQKVTKKSLQEGYGYYSDEISQGCFSSDGKCTTEGSEVTVQYCKPHPNTGRGCIGSDGKQTYNTIINRKPCNVQCSSNKITTEEGLRLSDASISYSGTSLFHSLESLGCDKIIDKKFGIDMKSYFLGTFDQEKAVYPLKTCIPQEKYSPFQGYYQKVATCLPHDSKGENNCLITCGRDKNILNLTGFSNAKLNKNLLNYFPTEINEQGDVRNVCYDINNKDQVELLNYPGKVPPDFVYPEKCYKHTNVLDFTENIWPVSGTNNVFNLEKVQVSKNISYIDLTEEQNKTFENYVLGKIISPEYDLNKDQNSYVKIRLGNDTALLEKVYPLVDSGLSIGSNLVNDTMYICFTGDNLSSQLLDFIEYLNKGSFGDNDFLTHGTPNPFFTHRTYFSDNSKLFNQYYYFYEDNSIYFPCSFHNFFREIPGKTLFFMNGDVPVLQNPEFSEAGGFDPLSNYYFYMTMENEITGDIQNVFWKGETQGSSSNDKVSFTTASGKNMMDYHNSRLKKIYTFTRAKQYNNKVLSISLDADFNGSVFWKKQENSGVSFKVDFSRSFITESTFLRGFSDSRANYNYLEIKEDANNLDKSDPYCIFATPAVNNKLSYNYPVFLEEKEGYEKVSFLEFPDFNFYTPKSNIQITANFLYRPLFYEDKPLKYFNEEILFSSCNYVNNYIKINGTNKYFISNLEMINRGMCYKKSDKNTPYYLYNSGVSGSGSYKLNSTISNKSGVSPQYAVSYNGLDNPETRTIKVIRGNDVLVTNATNSQVSLSKNQDKVQNYFEMIRYQNFASNSSEVLIFEPERHISLAADYGVFKSPYIIKTNGIKNFICYDQNGRALPEGSTYKITQNSSKVYTNISCPNKITDYEVAENGSSCAVEGVESTTSTSLEHCTQARNNKALNFLGDKNNCIVSEDNSEYRVINNQLEEGLQLISMKKSSGFGKPIENTAKTYPKYFTRLLDKNKIYRPGEEFYIDKLQNNYFISLTNNNIDFVDNIASWRRIFTFENNSISSPYQYFFSVYPNNFVNNNINVGLGPFSGTFGSNLKKSISSDLNISFSTLNSGINSQNYLNQGVTYFWGNQRRHLGDDGTHIGQPLRPWVNTAVHGYKQCGNKDMVYERGCLQDETAPPCNGNAIKVTQNSCLANGCYPFEPGNNFTIWRGRMPSGTTFDNFLKQGIGQGSPLPTERGNLSSYIGRIKLSNYRNQYGSFAMTGTNNPDLPGIGPTPNWGGLKYQDKDTTTPSVTDLVLYPESPILATFNIIKTDSYKFSCKFYDSNIGTDFSTKINIGDFFNPDFIFFNTLIYSYILSSKTSYGDLGTSPSGYLQENFLYSNTSSKTLFNTQNSQKQLTITPAGGYNTPSVSDYLLFIPISFGTKNGDGEYGLDVKNFPYYYPTLQIKRIKSIDDSGTGLTITLYEKEYSNSKDFNSSKSLPESQIYIFNLGKSKQRNNLIDRTFEIGNITETSVKVVPKQTSDSPLQFGQPMTFVTNTTYIPYSFSKKYIEFEINIDGISQKTMETLYTNNKKLSDSKEYVQKGGNFLTPAVSARYIKAKSQTPFKKLSNNSYACLNNSTNEDTINNSFMSQCTRIRKQTDSTGTFYYIKEFREDKSNYDPQIKRTFQTGDTFNYYKNVINTPHLHQNSTPAVNPILSGNKNFVKFCSFKVVDVDIKLTAGNVSTVSDNEGRETKYDTDNHNVLVFDYKCTLINTYMPATISTPANVPVPSKLDYVLFDPLTSFNLYASYKPAPYESEERYEYPKDIQIPPTVVGADSTTVYTRAVDMGLCVSTYKIRVRTTTSKPPIITYGDNPSIDYTYQDQEVGVNDVHLDYYNFSSPTIKTYVYEPDYNTGTSIGTLYTAGSFIHKIAPTWLNLFGSSRGTPQATSLYPKNLNAIYGKHNPEPRNKPAPCIRQNEVNYLYPKAAFYGQIGVTSYMDPNIGFEAMSSIVNSTIYSGEAIRSGMLDMLVLSSTEMETGSGLKTTVDVTVSGKPYGVDFFLSAPGTSSAMINYESFGRIESFDISNKSGAQNFPEGTLLKSNKGFQIKILPKPPTSYSFENIESPSGKILPYQNNFGYSDSDIVNFQNTNLRQYFRNSSYFSIPYMKNIDIKNPLIPFSIYDSANKTWYYPVYKYPLKDQTMLEKTIEGNTVYYVKDQLFSKSNILKNQNSSNYIQYGTSQQQLSEYLASFHNVGVTVYPETNFTPYYKQSYYGAGDPVITSEEGKEVLYKSLVNGNTGNLLSDEKSWVRDGLTQTMTSMKENNFYGTYQQQGNNFTKFIDQVKNLNNQNYPASIELDSDDFGVSEFCPQPCTLYNLSEKYENSFVNAEYFESIRYLFETPTILSKKDKTSIISLGNAPVSKTKNYNTGYLQDGGAANNFLSQYLYSIDINGQEKKFNRPGCSGGLSVTTKDGLQQTEANKFDFSNSILFNFLPCDIDSQDFIKYSVNIGSSSGSSVTVTALDNYASTNTPNIFPPYGVSCNVLLSTKSGDNVSYQGVSGYFKYTHIISREGNAMPQKVSDGDVEFGFRVENTTINFMDSITIDDKFNYGDIWYNPLLSTFPSDTSPFGFLIPNPDKGISIRSFMQLNNGVSYASNPTQNIQILSNKNKSISVGVSTNIINRFSLVGVNDSMPGSSIYTGVFTKPDQNGLSIRIISDDSGTKPLSQLQAKFYRSDGEAMNNIENIYLPSYDISKNIKVKAIGVFGESFTGELSYSLDKNSSIIDLENQNNPIMIFNELRNDIFLTDIDKRKKEVFLGTSTTTIDNLYKTFIINFDKNNKTFSLKPNLFKHPILYSSNKLLYNKNSVDPGLCIGIISSESTTTFVSSSLENMIGTSVNIDFKEFLEFNMDYNKGSTIPGKSNLQVQFSEIRQNRTNNYIQENNRCSIYFEPELGSTEKDLVTSTWSVTYSTSSRFPSYPTSNVGERFSGEFSDSTELDLKSKDITVYLGCNLRYYFDQTDSSNKEPMVFGLNQFNTISGVCTSTVDLGSPGNKKFNIQYYIDNEKVLYSKYKTFFPKENNTINRKIEIMFQGDFGLTANEYDEANIFYGIPSKGSSVGGKIRFKYH